MAKSPLSLAVLISGGGRTMLNLHDAMERGDLDARIDVVVSSRSDAKGIGRARERGLTAVLAERRALGDRKFQQTITDAVSGADLVCMAGFLSLWQFPDDFFGRVLNIHPALLPAFGGQGMYGLRVHEAVLAAGCTESGCTVHVCDNEYDHGPIVVQRRVPVLPEDTPKDLGRRVFEQECIAYPEAVNLFCEGRVRIRDNDVLILDL